MIAMAPTAATSMITNGRDKAMRLPDRFGINKPRMNSVLCDRMALQLGIRQARPAELA